MRRGSSVASRNDEEVMDDSTPEQSPVTSSVRKRKRLDPTELCQQIYDSIRTIKKEDGSMLCDTFIRAPKRRQEPSYYEVVANPIDLLKVQQKLKTDSYDDVDELTQDIELLVNNAKAFYKYTTTEYQDACLLWQYYNTNKSRICEAAGVEEEPRAKKLGRGARRSIAAESDTSEASKIDEDVDQFEELFQCVMTASDQDDRPLYKEFQLLPSKKVYPDYYDVIESPVDLRLIATKIQNASYTNLNEMEKDLKQMTTNACLFNEPGSQIYKDAKNLKKIILLRKAEIETGKLRPTINKQRTATHSSNIANLKPLGPEDEDDDDDDDKGEGPMWKLFNHLYSAASASDLPNGTGAPLGQCLWKLPHRRFHPDYYEKIKRPISMSQIQQKLKKRDYTHSNQFVFDLFLMIDNTKQAYPPSHRNHKDAKKMETLLKAKMAEGIFEEEDDETDQDDESPVAPTPKKKGRPRIHPQIGSPNVATTPAPSRKSNVLNTGLKKRILVLHKAITDSTINGRRPALLFMEKPNRKLYPDYYDIINHPIDLNTIEHNIRTDRYCSLDDIVSDYKVMFNNCRTYNEEGSSIFEDANFLEKILNDKLKTDGAVEGKKTNRRTGQGVQKKVSPLHVKLQQFYDTIRDYHEPKGNRQLSAIFMKLPSKNDYPDYYDIIKNPIDFSMIENKIKKYESVAELASDFLLMLENACKYNEPDSQIYKDALVLQQLTIQTKQSIRDNDETVPDVALAVHELLLSLFTTLYNHQDEDGRCFSDSLAELPEHDDKEDGTKSRGISLDLLKRRLDKGSYKRLDTFQDDVFKCLERARKLSRTDSQVFEDSIEMQTFFIKTRDRLCKDTLTSPALKYTLSNLNTDIAAMQQMKQSQEEQDNENEDDRAAAQGESMTFDETTYTPGDFVYYTMPDNKIPGIAYIERLYTDGETGVKMMSGKLFFRPHETYHVTTRKFLENEIFVSGQHQNIPLDKILNKCYVMYIKDYIKFKPEGFVEKDVFVCESRYNIKSRSFKKIKTWPFVRENDVIKFVQRETPCELRRVMSVFKERVEKHKGELAELQLQEVLDEKEKPNIPCLNPPENAQAGCNYFEQYNTMCSGVVKLGDFVYVANQAGKQSIAQIHQIWEAADGKSFFQGPWLLPPSEISVPIQKQPYRQELLLSSVHDVTPIIAIVGRCAVLDYEEYTTLRPTEIQESDVFITESVFDELKKCMKKMDTVNCLKKFKYSSDVTVDEILHFKQVIKPLKDVKEEVLMEDSMDGGPSFGSDIATASPAPSIVSTPLTSKLKANKPMKKPLTGYNLYSSDVRKSICLTNPEATFGDISRLVGTEWKNLPQDQKQLWEDRASKINEENKDLIVTGGQDSTPSTNHSSSTDNYSMVFECAWNKCDYQFEDAADCLEHCIQDENGHVQNTFVDKEHELEYHCLWRRCIRIKKNMPAFPSLQRLVKHVREVHLSKGGRHVHTGERSKNFVLSKRVQMMHGTPMPAQNAVPSQMPHQLSPPPVQYQQPQIVYAAPPPEPMFVTVPPQPQRVVHSETYLKYIEGLQNNTTYITPFDKTIKTYYQPQAPATVDLSHIPTKWLGQHAKDKPEVVANAVWNLRKFMMKDVIEITRCGYD